MKDKLEQYISVHRDEFDSEQLPPKLWDKIANNLEEKKVRRLNIYKIMSVAASAVVILAAGLLIGLRIGSNTTDNVVFNEFARAESYYNNELRVKWSQVESAGVETGSLAEDLQQLDQVYTELKAELMQNPNINTDKMVNALIENYRTKIEILETVLDRTTNNPSIFEIQEDELNKI